MVNSEELIAIVNEHDKIIGTAKRGEVHEKGLLHREAYVFLIPSSYGKVLLQRRADDGKWTASAGGHFSPNEDYLQAAQREFQEELGIDVPVKFFKELCYERFKTGWKNEINDRFAKVFLLNRDIPISEFKPDPNEVAEVRYFNKHDIYNLVKEKTWLTRAARETLKRYLMHRLR